MRHFEMEMNDLKSRLVDMADLVQRMVRHIISQLVASDGKTFDEVFNLEREVNIQQIVIDDKCLKLIALNQPVGMDLRFITSAMKINSDLERMADEAVNICQILVDLLKYSEAKPLVDIPKMAEIAQQMVADSIKAFNTSDVELAQSVLVKDEEVDALKDEIFERLENYVIDAPSAATIAISIHLILMLKSVERIGDHSTNISEDVIFMVKGKDIRHPKTFKHIQK